MLIITWLVMVKIRNNVTLTTWNWFNKIWHIQPVRYSTTFRNRGAETDQWVFPGGGGGAGVYFSLSKYVCDFFNVLF